MLKNQYVKDLAIDTVVDSVFRVVSCHMRPSRRGQPFLSLSLADRTGRIAAKRWDVADQEYEDVRGLRFVRVQGVVEDYRGARQVRIDLPIEDAGAGLDPADYEPSAALKLPEMKRRLDALVDCVQEPPLRALLNAFFRDPKFRARFDEAPAAKALHHACRHGLLQHTIEVSEMVRAIAEVQCTWGYAGLSRDLAVTAALLHDIGKVRELDWSEGAYEYSTTGGLLGHIAIGYQMIFSCILQIPGFPTALRDALLHIVLAHHGKLEYGSPVTPMLREAVILSMADDLDARLFCMTEAAEEADDRDFAWHRAVEGNRVYAGDLGLGKSEQGGRSAPDTPEDSFPDGVSASERSPLAEGERSARRDSNTPSSFQGKGRGGGAVDSVPPEKSNPSARPPTDKKDDPAQPRLDIVNPAAAFLNTAGRPGGSRRRPGR